MHSLQSPSRVLHSRRDHPYHLCPVHNNVSRRPAQHNIRQHPPPQLHRPSHPPSPSARHQEPTPVVPRTPTFARQPRTHPDPVHTPQAYRTDVIDLSARSRPYPTAFADGIVITSNAESVNNVSIPIRLLSLSASSPQITTSVLTTCEYTTRTSTSKQ
ncbi:hypothetical protein BD311DRAFT_747537 [Dichomitus squalens]|uniref:Uncharacterized protein n=1 Tax=Dichomitus squalens TaxID=114155 RepID=A0A4Q9N1G7_9APHY|nr:hypothetical protein BD311DRAFT_747537 [Dichomitus squalens]